MIADAFIPLVQREMGIKQQDIQDHEVVDAESRGSDLASCFLYGIA